LASVPIGRVGLTIDAVPIVLPVNFAILDDDIVFRTVEGTKFHAASTGTVLAFEVDGYAPDGEQGWSVVVQGPSQVVSDPTEVYRIRELIADPWAVDSSADRAVRIKNTIMSGRRFDRHHSRKVPT
jgi:nitroimidazol reductase NimA-like FMN-containing flavoprotein (pyridoxamine 5'-phosphate oxidase superfamily)